MIIVYIEAIAELDKFKAACRLARAAGKSIVALKLGSSEGGRQAAMAHTGSLAGTMEAFDAVVADLGDHPRRHCAGRRRRAYGVPCAHGCAEGRRQRRHPFGRVSRHACEAAGHATAWCLSPLTAASTEKLNTVLGVGSMVSNPIDGGFAVLSSHDNFKATITALEDDPNVDMILFQEKLPGEAGSDRAEIHFAMIEDMVVRGLRKPIAAVALASHGLTQYGP